MFNPEEKKRIIFVSTLFLIALFLYVNLFVITQVNDSEVIEKNLILKLPNEERLLREMLLWPNLVKAVHTGNWSISQDKESIDALYFRDCWNDKDWIRLVCSFILLFSSIILFIFIYLFRCFFSLKIFKVEKVFLILIF